MKSYLSYVKCPTCQGTGTIYCDEHMRDEVCFGCAGDKVGFKGLFGFTTVRGTPPELLVTIRTKLKIS